jgi:hypothetical protein
VHRGNDLPAITIIGWRGRKRQEWYSHGRRHRIGKPAIISYDVKEWWHRGKRHRIGKPAYINKISTCEKWYVDGELHRDGDLPAIYSVDGTMVSSWYHHGNLHRDNGPAEVDKNYKIWYKNNIMHRVDGPAIENSNTKERKWAIYGNEIPDTEVTDWLIQNGNPTIPLNDDLKIQFMLRFGDYAAICNE